MASLVYLITSRHKCMSSGPYTPNPVLYPFRHPHSLPSSQMLCAWTYLLYGTYFLFVHLHIVHLLPSRYLVCSYSLRLPNDWWFPWLSSEHVTNVCVCVFFLEEWKKETSIYFSSIIFRKSHTECLFKDFEVKSHLNWYQNITFKTYIKRS